MEVLKCFKFLSLKSVLWACTDKCEPCIDEFLTMVTEGVVHGVYKVMTQCNTAT